jgi:fatty-acyl-CoA synthase
MTEIAGDLSRQPAAVSGPVLETTVGGVLREAADDAAGVLALVEGTGDPGRRRRWTYSELLVDSERVARALLGRFAPGERVAICAPTSPEWVLTEFGAALAGLTLVTVNPDLGRRQVEQVLRQTRAHGLLLAPTRGGGDLAASQGDGRGNLPDLREVIHLADWDGFAASGSPTERLPEVSPADPAQIHYTFAPTTTPRGAVLHHRGITNGARFWMEILDGGPGDVWVNPMPIFHPAGCVLMTLGAVQGGFAQVLPAVIDPGLMLHLIESERGTIFGGVPSTLGAQLEHPDFSGRDLSSVRCAAAGGATVLPALVRRVESALDVPLSTVFARIEASAPITQTRLDDSPTDRAETLGRPHPQVEVRIADVRTHATVPSGTVGEVLTRGYHVMSGYFDDPAATAQAIDAEGWLHTHQLGSMDERGYCRIEGRLEETVLA